jgi:hypothetical protein
VKAALIHPDRLTVPKHSRASARAFVVCLFNLEPRQMHMKRRLSHSEYSHLVDGKTSQHPPVAATGSANDIPGLRKAIQYP